MNKLLQLNKKLLLSILFVLIFIIIAIIVIKKNENSSNNIIMKNSMESNYDIVNPRFTINNKDEKISIKASGGNFLSNGKILLEKNVVFKSPKFTLSTEKVIFNQINQSAESTERSKFQAKGTTIVADGFKIDEKGDVIFFNGNTMLKLKKQIN